jgi:tetratricopeptide (TPR) repeat protein
VLELGSRLSDGTHHDVRVQRVCDDGVTVTLFGSDQFNESRVTVLKSLRPSLLKDPNIYERFVNEGLRWSGLWPHPNIIGVYGVAMMGEDVCAAHPFIALEYAERGNLRDWLNHGWVTREMALAWAQCVAAGLTYLHEPDPAYLRPEPIAHGNLSPANVLIQGNGAACLTNFGLASVFAESGHSGAELGAFAYLAPERRRDARDVETPADVYALGVTLYELFTGQHPLLDIKRDYSQQAWRQAHEILSPVPLRTIDPSLPEELEALALACLAKDPRERPSARMTWKRLQEIARDLGTPVWEAPEIVSHSSYNELVYWSNWSDMYACLERWEEALERMNRALQVAPRAVSALRAQGDILVWQQRYDEAEATYQTALQYVPDDTERGALWGRLGGMYNEAGNDARWAQKYTIALARCKQADEAYARQMELSPHDAGATFNRAVNQRLWAVAEEGCGQVAVAVKRLKSAKIYADAAVRLGDTAAAGYVRTICDHLRQLGESCDDNGE